MPCAPYTLTRWTENNGEVQEKQVEIHGRKIPLSDVRKKLLENQEDFMHLETDEQLESRLHDELIHKLAKANVAINPSQTTAELRDRIKYLQRCRHLLMWHGHATMGTYLSH